MRIGEVAAAAGVPTQTIRFYERRGLLPQPQRGANGYREYDPSVLARLAFIRSGQAAGLTLLEVSSILQLRRDGTVPCAHVDSLLHSKLDGIRARQRELAELEAELQGLISRSDQLDPADCTDTRICHIIAPDSGTGPGTDDT
ncbi:heavy metal-responsive transcriptional regulator [Streptomyces sp. NP160]|uniref:heavy metal-responsive transcriptional regulator n=1 Tax=Streptomyces sp. NP160 TaxID=2586637 RepID=UPI001119F9BA|nr:heavy metal-responsive transcriptional regulator [Streptomyces sp. NP160]TNM61935.1 heavy metal-responsive transcriptional regulator [Streptomyces sp. NP160]